MAYVFLQGCGREIGNECIIPLIERTVTKIDIPYGVTGIGKFAFGGCGSVKSFTIPDSVTEIGSQACIGLGCDVGVDEVLIPDSVMSLGANAFAQSGVKKFVISKNISKIEEGVFKECSQCREYDFTKHASVPTLISVNSFENIQNYSAPKILVPLRLYDGWRKAHNWTLLAEYLTFKPSVGLSFSYDENENAYRLVGRGDFVGDEVVIPDSYDDGIHGSAAVTNFEIGCFDGDDFVTAVYVPETVKYFGFYAFSRCKSLKKIYLTGVTSISSFEFSELESLEYVKFSKNISGINGGTFTGANGAVYDFSDALQVPYLGSYGYGEEFGTDPIIKVPAALFNQWKNDTNWSIYADHIVAAD